MSRQFIVRELSSCGVQARVYPLLIDKAARECNIVVLMNGILGNFVYRSLCYLGGTRSGGGVTLTTRLISIDTTRYNDRFSFPIECAVAIVNVGGVPNETG